MEDAVSIALCERLLAVPYNARAKYRLLGSLKSEDKKASILPRKEVIHAQLPLGMPCYDLLLITDLTVAPTNAGSSGTISSPELTGGI